MPEDEWEKGVEPEGGRRVEGDEEETDLEETEEGDAASRATAVGSM